VQQIDEGVEEVRNVVRYGGAWSGTMEWLIGDRHEPAAEDGVALMAEDAGNGTDVGLPAKPAARAPGSCMVTCTTARPMPGMTYIQSVDWTRG